MNKIISEKVFILLFTVYCVILSLSFGNVQQDDSYIFYTYAKNIAEGNGYVFNIGEKINATTSPLYTILIATLYVFFRWIPGITIPLIAHIIGAICLWMICYFTYKIFKRARLNYAAILFPMLFLTNPLLKNAVGMETFLSMMLIILSLYYYLEENYYFSAIISTLSVLARPDSVLFSLLLFYDYFIRKRKYPDFRLILTIVLTILPWLLFSYFYFGRLIPSTYSVKVFQSNTGFFGTGLVFLKGFFLRWSGGIFVAIVFLFFLLSSLLYVFLRSKDLVKINFINIILLWSLLYLVVYGFILNPPSYQWYYTPLSIGISLIIALAFELFFTNILRYIKQRAYYIISLLVIIFALGLILPVKTFIAKTDSKYDNYINTASWLNEHAFNGAAVGIDEVGILGYYYKHGKIIDALGLITPGVLEHQKKMDYEWYVHNYKPDFLVVDYPNPPVYHRFIFKDWFKARYEKKTIIINDSRSIVIYKRL